jgi:hypothetical protein
MVAIVIGGHRCTPIKTSRTRTAASDCKCGDGEPRVCCVNRTDTNPQVYFALVMIASNSSNVITSSVPLPISASTSVTFCSSPRSCSSSAASIAPLRSRSIALKAARSLSFFR